MTDTQLDTMQLRLAGIVDESVVDGLGIRMTVFVQGCPHRCKGCHNPASWDSAGGKVYPLRFVADLVQKDPLLDGVTFSGGEPFAQPAPLAVLAAWLHSRGMNVWCYSGYTYEQLVQKAQTDADTAALLQNIDVLVDGPFVEAQRDLTLKFRGSANQRVLDMPRTRAQNAPVWLDGMQE